MTKLCIIYNTAPRYREAIFSAIDAEYDCDWYFGRTKSDIKEMDTSLLKRVTYYETVGNPDKLYWKRGLLRLLLRKDYCNFFMLAEVRSVTDWFFLWLAATFFPKKRVYLWTHGWYGRESGIIARLKLWSFGHVAGTFVYGDRARCLLIEQGIDADKLWAIHNSLHYDEQLAIRNGLKRTARYVEHFGNTDPVLVFIGRLTAVKRLDMLIDALAMLRQQGCVVNAVLVGDGTERCRLEQMVSIKGLADKVWFYGASYGESENAQLLYDADLCVSPGNVGLTAIHAMTFGTPVVSHNKFENQMPEFEAIKPGVTGDFFEHGDVAQLAFTIARWLDNHKTDREKVRQNCYEEIDTKWNPHYQIDLIRKKLKLV